VARYYQEMPQAIMAANSIRPVTVTYPNASVQTGDLLTAQVRVNIAQPIEMAMIDLAVPPGLQPLVEDLEALKAAGTIARYECSGPQLLLYLTRLDRPATFRYRLRALFPVEATVRASVVYPYYQPARRYVSGTGRICVR
jgi:hypothetical protein